MDYKEEIINAMVNVCARAYKEGHEKALEENKSDAKEKAYGKGYNQALYDLSEALKDIAYLKSKYGSVDVQSILMSVPTEYIVKGWKYWKEKDINIGDEVENDKGEIATVIGIRYEGEDKLLTLMFGDWKANVYFNANQGRKTGRISRKTRSLYEAIRRDK